MKEVPFLYRNGRYIFRSSDMFRSGPDVSGECCLLQGTHLLHRLADDGAGFAGGQFRSCLHLELVHCLMGLGDIQLFP